ncbi:MAG: thioredoxin family protein [Bacteroidota bacterium]|nr:thioredoxin family protein [Bacteroidota bacterium]
MLRSFFILIVLFIISSTVSKAQTGDKYKLMKDEKSGRQMLIGQINREALSDTSFSWWFNSEYDNYTVKSKELDDSVKEEIRDYDITIVLGTWCSDSRREIPRFLKILDSLGFDSGKVKLLAVDREKKGLGDEIDSLKIELVPTIIFYKDGKEAGRITEAPVETLETDTNNIITSKGKVDSGKEKS